ncbi:MAG TPA: hypothetical protein V6C84_00820 [Coleofasciculaceae cyanobacterium]|jgi:hypothetical protein
MNTIEVGTTYNTFFHLVKELESFVDTSELRIAFDAKGNAYLIGNGFVEQLQANFALHREVKEVMRQVIAKHCSRIHPQL